MVITFATNTCKVALWFSILALTDDVHFSKGRNSYKMSPDPFDPNVKKLCMDLKNNMQKTLGQYLKWLKSSSHNKVFSFWEITPYGEGLCPFRIFPFKIMMFRYHMQKIFLIHCETKKLLRRKKRENNNNNKNKNNQNNNYRCFHRKVEKLIKF